MRFNPSDLAEPAADLRYAPNKLHGDEIESTGGTTFREQSPHERFSNGEVEEPRQVYRMRGDPLRAWRRRLSALYISDAGRSDQRIGWSLIAYRWVAADASEALVFRVDC